MTPKEIEHAALVQKHENAQKNSAYWQQLADKFTRKLMLGKLSKEEALSQSATIFVILEYIETGKIRSKYYSLEVIKDRLKMLWE